jgi:hypothetical protein
MGKTCHQDSGKVSVGSIWEHTGQLPYPRRRGPTSQNAVRLKCSHPKGSSCFPTQNRVPASFLLLGKGKGHPISGHQEPRGEVEV